MFCFRNELYLDEPDIRGYAPGKTNFCERIVYVISIKTSDASCVITDSFDDFLTRSSKFSYLWFFKA